MDILILGSQGMAGHTIAKYLKQKNINVVCAARNNEKYVIDVENKSSIREILSLKNFDYIINCIGLLVKDSNETPDRAALVNSWFPHYLEFLLKDTSTKLIHLSTDCVFNGSKGNYVEEDIHDEMNFYGRSKSFGEVNNKKDITFRMSIIGPEIKSNGTGLLHWILNNKATDLPGWENVWWNGITTLQLAKCIELYMKSPTFSGVYHLVNNNLRISKYELLSTINNIFNLNKNIIKVESPKFINKILIDTRKTINFNIQNYDVQISELKSFIEDYKLM